MMVITNPATSDLTRTLLACLRTCRSSSGSSIFSTFSPSWREPRAENPHSGLIAPLKKTSRGSCKKREETEPPPGTDPGDEEYHHYGQADSQDNQTALQPLSTFFYADVGDTNIFYL